MNMMVRKISVKKDKRVDHCTRLKLWL